MPMRKLTWIDWLAATVAVLVPLVGWLVSRKPRERRRAQRASNRAPPGPQIRR